MPASADMPACQLSDAIVCPRQHTPLPLTLGALPISPCCVQQHWYQPAAGQNACNPCPPGSDTADEGNIACTKCARGYFNNADGEPASLPVSQLAAVTGRDLQRAALRVHRNTSQCNGMRCVVCALQCSPANLALAHALPVMFPVIHHTAYLRCLFAVLKAPPAGLHHWALS